MGKESKKWKTCGACDDMSKDTTQRPNPYQILSSRWLKRLKRSQRQFLMPTESNDERATVCFETSPKQASTDRPCRMWLPVSAWTVNVTYLHENTLYIHIYSINISSVGFSYLCLKNHTVSQSQRAEFNTTSASRCKLLTCLVWQWESTGWYSLTDYSSILTSFV